jgi:hypothetical protein
MTDPIVTQAETTAKTLGQKAWGWLQVHWYAFLIGAVAGFLVAKIV